MIDETHMTIMIPALYQDPLQAHNNNLKLSNKFIKTNLQTTLIADINWW